MPKIIVKDHKYYFKIRGLGGVKGDKGDTGPAGTPGPQGPYVNVVAGTTTTLPAGSSAQVTVNNTGNTSTLNFGIPQGNKGDKGDAGTPGAQGPRGFAATVNVGETTTGQPGTNASVVNAGNEHDAVLKFTIPKGEKGETGETGPQGPTGGVKSTVVAELPETGESDKYYLVYRDSEGGTITTTDGHAQIENGENGGDLTASQLLGNAEQTTYSGKNLLPPTADWTQTVSDVKITCSNGQYTFSGTATANGSTTARATVAQYTIQSGDYFHYGNTLVSDQINIQIVFTDATYFATSMNAANRVVSLESYVGKTISSCRVNFASGFAFNGTASPMILHNVSTVADYEPYVGGIPAPNPDYPQPVSTVTGAQTVRVTGKNLLDITQSSVINQGTYVSGANTSTYTIKATGNDLFVNAASAAGASYASTIGNLISCNYGETVYFNVGNNNFQKNYFTEWDENLVSLGYTLVSSSSGTYTPTRQGCKYVNFRFGNGYSVPDTTYTLSPIVCKTSDTSFEPYQGQSQEINLGKNLWGGFTYIWASSWNFNTVFNEDGSFSISGNASANTWSITTAPALANACIKLEAGTYTFSFSGTASRTQLVSVRPDGTGETAVADISATSGSKTFTLTETRCLYPRMQVSAGDTSLTEKCMIQVGSQETSYAPYFTPIELSKVGAYQDYIWNDGGTWKIHKSTAVAVLNGTENWAESGSTYDRFLIGSAQTTFSLLAKGTPSYKSKCDHFTFQEGGTAWTGIGKCGFDGLGTFWCMISGMSSLADFKTWLGTNNVRVYYPLATPTDAEITDGELIAQLDAVASLFPGVNNIWIIPSSGAQGELTGNYVVYDKYNRHKVYIWSSDDNTWQIILQ